MVAIFFMLLGWQLQAEVSTNAVEAQWLQKQYVTVKEAEDHSQDYSEVALGWNYIKKGENWDRGLDGQMFFSVGRRGEVYAHLREAFLTYKLNKHNKIDFGRVKKPWSLIDKHWALGLWEPSLKTDGFQFSREGMAGLFYNQQTGPWRLTLYASPLFLPDQGPQVKVEEGQLISYNRWFNNRVESVRIGEINSPLVYTLHTPEVNDVLFQESFAVDMSWQGKKVSAHIAFADKPINQLFIGVQPLHNVSVKNVRKESYIHLYPQVHRHRLYTAELNLF